MRAGDLAVRVHMQRGDYLSEIAFEFNKVLDWLNENPPEGARTGSDVVDMYAPPQDDDIDPELVDQEAAEAAAAAQAAEEGRVH